MPILFLSLALLGLAAAPAAPATDLAQAFSPGPLPAEAASDEPVGDADAAARRAAIDAMVDLRLLESGHFQLVVDREEQAGIAEEMERGLRSLGITATMGACRWMGLVAAGTARGHRSYGAACQIRIGDEPARDFLICHSQAVGALTLVHPAWFAYDEEYIELFIRRACF